jgi:hypothetical protein
MKYKEGQRVYVYIQGNKTLATITGVFSDSNRYSVRFLDDSTAIIDAENVEGVS